MIPTTAQLNVEHSKIDWQDKEKKRWLLQRDKAYNYYKGRTEAYTKGFFSPSLNAQIPCPNVNITKRVIDRISLVYMTAPFREYSNEDIAEMFHNKNHEFLVSATYAELWSKSPKVSFRYRSITNQVWIELTDCPSSLM